MRSQTSRKTELMYHVTGFRFMVIVTVDGRRRLKVGAEVAGGFEALRVNSLDQQRVWKRGEEASKLERVDERTAPGIKGRRRRWWKGSEGWAHPRCLDSEGCCGLGLTRDPEEDQRGGLRVRWKRRCGADVLLWRPLRGRADSGRKGH